MSITYERIREAVEKSGFVCRGGLHPKSQDQVPGVTGTVVLVGNAGDGMWGRFSGTERDGADPLDAWTRKTLEALAAELGCRAVFPFDGPPPYHFLRWALRAEPVQTSPLGLLIHPEWGLWHAFRGAFLFEDVLELPARPHTPSPCVDCADKPCLTACPVEAFRTPVYDVSACVNHLDSPRGEECMSGGCIARRACPAGVEWTYPQDQMQFHMEAFLDRYKPARVA